MLKGTLDRLQGLLSRHYLIGYVLPTLFLVILSLALYEVALAETVGRPGWSILGWYSELGAVLQSILALLGTVVFVTLTFVLALLVPVLRQVLEGRYFPEGVKVTLRAAHRDRLWHYKEQRRGLAPLHRVLSEQETELRRKLKGARFIADRLTDPLPGVGDPRQLLDRANTAIGLVWQEADPPVAVSHRLPEAIEYVRHAVIANLKTRKAETELLINRLNDTTDHLRDRLSEQDAYLANRQGEEFPRDLLAPTRLGNVADAIRSRIHQIYGMDSDFFWPRLEALLPETSGLKQEILDGKAKLDAMVLLCFYAALFSVVWLAVILIYEGSPWLFLGVGLLGPLAAVFFYSLAVQSYLVLGQSMHSAVDLHRFDLISGLKVDLPGDKATEKDTWTSLQKALAYGESDELSYKHE